MKTSLKWTNLEPIESIAVFVDDKIGGLEKFVQRFGEAVEVWVEVGRTSQHHKTGESVYRAEADMRLPGKVLRAEAENSDLRVAITEVKEELQRQIVDYKEYKNI